MSEEQFPSQSGPTIMLFVILGMLMGGIFRQLNKKTKFPYTPMPLILGLILGYYRKHLGVVGESTDILQKLNPHMILFIFIPILIFESAFNFNWFVFRKSLINILILTVPGVLLGAILMGVCFKVFLFYSSSDLSWSQAFALGSILSATDPTAVIALLKQLGANVQFNTLIQGQSLLNSGTATVFFIIFIDIIKGNTTSIADSIGSFLRLSVGGLLLGLFIGYVTSKWLKRIFYDNILIANITFVSCYLMFFIAEFTWVHVSGILSVVAFGLYMSAYQKTTIYSQSEETLHTIWAFIQYICQTIVFLLTGVIIGVEIIQRNNIRTSDWARLLFGWIFMIFTRFLMIAIFYPLLKKYGYGMNKKQFIVTVYGGLKGSISLCLALMVMMDTQFSDRFRELTIFYTSGLTILTVLINGLTCHRIVNYVQMIVISPIKDKLFKACLKKISKEVKQKVQDLKVERFMLLADWKTIQPLSKWSLNQNQRVNEPQMRQLSNRVSLMDGIEKQLIDEETRFRILRFIKTAFWQSYEKGECSEESVLVLSNSIDILIEQTQHTISLWDIVMQNFTFYDIPYWMKIKSWSLIGRIAERVILNRVCFVHDVCSTLVAGCHEAISAFIKNYPVGREHVKVITDEIQDNITLAQEYLSQLQHTYQSLFVSVHTQKAATNILFFKKKQLKQMKEKGFIDENQFSEVKSIIARQLVDVKGKTEIRWDKLTFQQILLECPLFSGLTKEQLRTLKISSQEKQFRQGQTIQLKNSNLTLAYIIIEGIVQQIYSDYKAMRSIGGMISLHSVLIGNSSLCTAMAHTSCTVLGVQLNAFRKLIAQNKQIQMRVYKASFPDAVKNDRKNRMSLYPDRVLKHLSNRSTFLHLQQKEIIGLPHGGYVFNGIIQLAQKRNSSIGRRQSSQELFKFNNFISAGVTVIVIKSSTILLFKQKFYEEIEEKQANVINSQKVLNLQSQ